MTNAFERHLTGVCVTFCACLTAWSSQAGMHANGTYTAHTAGRASGSTLFGSYTSGSGPFQIVVNFDASVSKAPLGFVSDVDAVADYFTGHFANSATITINVGYGEVAGSKISPNALGESISSYSKVPSSATLTSYQNLANAYANYDPGIALPTNDPISSKHAYFVTTAEGKALRLLAPSTKVDGYVGFTDASGTFSYDPNNVPGTLYDFTGTVAHEFSEVMGRQVLVGEKSQGVPGYMPFDLFHYAMAAGLPTYRGTTHGYFSLDGLTDYDTGQADFKSFNTKRKGDFGDWAPVKSAPDAFDAFGGRGGSSPISYVDYLAMQAIGWSGTGWHGGHESSAKAAPRLPRPRHPAT